MQYTFLLKEVKMEKNSINYRVIYCRYRKVRGNSGKILDAHDYGYKSWRFYVRCK